MSTRRIEVQRRDLRPGDKLIQDNADGSWIVEREWKATPIKDLPIGSIISWFEDHSGGNHIRVFAERVTPRDSEPADTLDRPLEWRVNGFDMFSADSLQFDIDRNPYGDWVLLEEVRDR